MPSWIKNILNSPLYIGIAYLLIVIIFGLTYWINPNFWPRPLGFIESFYFSVITITTLGYGDISPITDISRTLASLEALFGILLIGVFLNAIAHKYSEEISSAAKNREDSQWRPARLLVARHICKVHQMLFNSFRWVVKHDHHADLSMHNFPKDYTQRDADAWQKEHHIKHLDYHYNELKKMIEYNNVALDSTLLPKAMAYVESAKDVLNNCKFVVTAYKDKSGSIFKTSFDNKNLETMEEIYEELLSIYPEIKEMEKPIGPSPLSSNELQDLVVRSNEGCNFLQFMIKNNL